MLYFSEGKAEDQDSTSDDADSDEADSDDGKWVVPNRLPPPHLASALRRLLFVSFRPPYNDKNVHNSFVRLWSPLELLEHNSTRPTTQIITSKI